jgi:1-aminocyclopropane-1-carboxylate deaminase
MHQLVTNIQTNKLENKLFDDNQVNVFLRREDLIHPQISGNKWRKLKYNVSFAIENKKELLITFGGAHSNHIAATAAAGNLYNIKTIGIIRGDYFTDLSPTLLLAKQNGMELHFVSIEDYKLRYTEPEKLIPNEINNYHLIPEGGANELGLKGTREIISEKDELYEYIFTPIGTGNTFAGIVLSSKPHQKVIGINVLKNQEDTFNNISDVLKSNNYFKDNWIINNDYHLGGYAKNNPKLVSYLYSFNEKHKIKLDPIYTGKMMFAVEDLISSKSISNSNILCIHTGGLQGIEGFEKRYKISLF